uniref:Uncharacterized protein n=1 Tax=Rhizophora mucronata TaxID=61149 RepID=A0A2P2MY13_RHIMU
MCPCDIFVVFYTVLCVTKL